MKIILGVLSAVGILIGLVNWENITVNLQHLYYQSKYPTVKSDSVSRLDTLNFKSKSFSGISKEVKVYLPKDYFGNDKRRFPVLYLLHGFPGSDSDWLINADLQKQLDQLMDSRVIPPIIVIFPDGNGPTVHDGQYLNATKINQPVEDYILEVVHEIDTRYSTINDRQSRALGGLSAGAYGAMNIGLHKNDLFAIIISHSGYFINEESVTKKLLNPTDIQADYNNPIKYIQKINLISDTYIYIDIGKSDNKNYISENNEMDKILTKIGIEHDFIITSGRHDWEVWRKNIIESLKFLGKHIKT